MWRKSGDINPYAALPALDTLAGQMVVELPLPAVASHTDRHGSFFLFNLRAGRVNQHGTTLLDQSNLDND